MKRTLIGINIEPRDIETNKTSDHSSLYGILEARVLMASDQDILFLPMASVCSIGCNIPFQSSLPFIKVLCTGRPLLDHRLPLDNSM